MCADTPQSARYSFRRVAGGAILGAVALWLTLRGVDRRALADSFASVHLWPALLALGATILSVVLVAWRWQVLFRPDRPDVSLWLLFRLAVIGQMLNIVVPLRVGELSRLYGMCVLTDVPAGRVLATLAVEKALELAVFGAAAASTVALLAFPEQLVRARLAWVVVPLLAIGVLWLIAIVAPRVGRQLGASSRIPNRARHYVSSIADGLATGLRNAASWRAGAALLILSAAAMLSSALANQLLFAAFDLRLPIWAGLALLVVLQVGAVPPSLPGRLGVFNYLTVVTLVWLGVDRVTAASFSLVLYAIAYLPKLALGAAFMAVDARLRHVDASAMRVSA